MSKICYISKRFSRKSIKIIDQANEIISEFQEGGFELTLRQLYYQFVSRDLIPNRDSEYKKLGSVINDGRLAGEIDWTAIVDRTRNIRENPHWSHPSEILKSAADQYAIDKWQKQKIRCEVWIEKDALIGVIEKPCTDWDVPYFSCRGYTSQSEMWSAAQRMRNLVEENGCKIIVLHLGDHDPSGIDMTRDIQDRLKLLSVQSSITVKRIALNMDQIKKYDPPPNPAKLSDSRAADYINNFGHDSWELDALDPVVLQKLVSKHIQKLLNLKKYDEYQNLEYTQKAQVRDLSDNWEKN